MAQDIDALPKSLAHLKEELIFCVCIRKYSFMILTKRPFHSINVFCFISFEKIKNGLVV